MSDLGVSENRGTLLGEATSIEGNTHFGAPRGPSPVLLHSSAETLRGAGVKIPARLGCTKRPASLRSDGDSGKSTSASRQGSKSCVSRMGVLESLGPLRCGLEEGSSRVCWSTSRGPQSLGKCPCRSSILELGQQGALFIKLHFAAINNAWDLGLSGKR